MKIKASNIILVVLLCLIIILIAFIPKIISCVSIDDYSKFGQYFGGLASTFVSLFVFGIILYTFILQSKQLQESKNANEIQNFENNFYQLLTVFNVLTQNINNRNGGFEKLYANLFRGYLFNLLYNIHGGRIPDKSFSRKEIEFQYLEFYKKNQDLLGNYFRTLFHVLKLINTFSLKKSNLNSQKLLIEDTKFYSNILRSQISNYALVLLFFNSLTSKLSYYDSLDLNFKKLIEKYNFFEHLNLELLLVPHPEENAPEDFRNLISFYDKNAFINNKDTLQFYESIN